MLLSILLIVFSMIMCLISIFLLALSRSTFTDMKASIEILDCVLKGATVMTITPLQIKPDNFELDG